MLAGRSAIQRRDLRLADAIVCPSKLFATQLAQDYGLQAERIHVIPNAVDLERFIPSPAGSRHPPEIVFASRLAVRKGVEMVVDLSHRLENGTGSAGIVVAGDGTMWSDYRWLLGGLNPSTAKYVGYVEPEAAAGFLGGAALLVQPSHYEPFSLSVAEALASGTPVVVSDRVGAGEWLKSECAVVFPAGDADAFEAAVRTMCLRMDRSEQEIRAGARQLAEQHFAPSIVARKLLDVFESVRRARPWSQ
jgi:glycosyltransferase involved in cell wall biosynthesis